MLNNKIYFCRKVYEEHKVIKSKTDITKKTAAKEMEQNEKLSGFKARIQGDINVLEKQGLYTQSLLNSINNNTF